MRTRIISRLSVFSRMSSAATIGEHAVKRVVVVGAGWAGLVAGKTYLEVDPTIQLTIFDSERTLGGVWNADRNYPGFLADSPVGLFDYSDLPMRDVIGLKDWSDIPGEKVYDYLKAYAEKFSLVERMRLGTKVSRISRNIDKQGWDVELENSGEVVTCDKLIVSSGLASKPNWPDVATEDFSGPVMHSKDVGLNHMKLTSDKVNRVTVYGGCKSAIDTIILCIMAGKKVDWVIRETGNGPGMMLEIRKRGFHGAALVGRWKNIFTPSIFAIHSFWYRFLHSGKSKLGSWICSRVWSKASTVPLTMEPYKSGGRNMEKLKPETGDALFFTASASALHGNEKFTKNLQSGELIEVHRATINTMSGSSVSLSNGETIPADAVVFATSWDYKSAPFDPADAINLGIPTPIEHQDTDTATYWENLHVKAEKEVLDIFPVLKNPPPFHERKVKHSPFRLYHHILPSALAANQDRSLVLLGLVTNIQTSIYAEISALWGVSWMEGLLDVPSSKDEMDYEIAKVNAWCARRYLSRGRTRQIISAEVQDVVDMLMVDMGLKVKRKWNPIADIFVPYRSQDYKGVVQEMLKKSRTS